MALAILIAASTDVVDSNASIEQQQSNAKATYKILCKMDYGLRFVESEFPYSFTNQINGAKVTYPASWGAVEYEYAHNTSNGKNATVWCIQPGVVINGADYFKVGEGGNSNYWNKLNDKNHKKIKKAISGTIAYAKANGGSKSDSPYYYAALLLNWDYIQGIRSVSAPYSVKSDKKSNINKIKNTKYKDRVTDVQKAAKDIIESMNDEDKPLSTLKNKNKDKKTKLYASISTAKKWRTDRDHSIILPADKNSTKKNGSFTKYTAMSAAKFSSLKGRKDIKYIIVNEKENQTKWAKKNISVKLNSKGKIQVTTKVNLKDFEETKGHFYVKIIKTPKGYTKGNNEVYQSATGKHQTMVNLAYKADDTTAYFPIEQLKEDEEWGSLVINKSITTPLQGYEITDTLADWAFKVEYTHYQGAKKTAIVVTDEEGATELIEQIMINSDVKITELGRVLEDGAVKSNYYNVSTNDGKTYYGFPKDIKDVTGGSTEGSVKSKKIRVTSITEPYEMEWENQKTLRIPIYVRKENSDADDPSGYYFFVYDYQTYKITENDSTRYVHNPEHKLTRKPQIIGPTDKDGLAGFWLDNITKDNIDGAQIRIVELGKLKPGESANNIENLSYKDIIWDRDGEGNLSNKIRERFYIPTKYKIVNDGSLHAQTSVTDAVRLDFTREEKRALKADPDSFEKTFSYVNEAEGMIKLKKQAAENGKDLAGAVYGIYQYNQNNGEDGYKGEESNANNEGYNVEQEDEPDVTEPDTETSNIEEDDIANSDSLYSWEYGRLGWQQGIEVDDETALSGIYRRTNAIDVDGHKQIKVNVLDADKKVQWNIFWYDEDDNYISAVDMKNPPERYNGETVDIPAKATSFRIVCHRATSLGGIDAVEDAFLDDKIITFDFVEEAYNEYDSDEKGTADDTGKLLDTLTTVEGDWVYSKALPCGTYYLQEIKAPSDKYTVDDTKYKFTIEAGMNTQETALPIIRTDKPTNVEFYKIDGKTVKGNATEDGKLLAGAKIYFYEKPESGKIDYNTAPVVYVIDSTSNEKPESIVAVFDVGKTYIAHEASTPNGYFTADDVEFTVSKDGSVDKVYMKDEPIPIYVSKLNITNNKELPGCKLKITGKDGVVDEWTSGDTPHLVNGDKFVEGETYTLTETNPKDGYTKAESVNFKIYKGMPTTVTMKDDTTKLRFSKQGTTESEGVATTAEVPGCHLRITDMDGKDVVEPWISTNEPHIIEGQLKINTDYYMVETSAAPGWKIAEPVKFHVDNTGKVQDVVMVDEPQPSVYFSKKSLTGNEELEGCKLEVRDANDKVVDSWISDKTPHIIEDLIPGETYSMVETKPVDGYATAEKVTFVVPKDPKAITVTMKDAPTELEFSKTKITGSKELPGCKLKITDEKGKTLYHWTSTNKPHVIKGKLAINKTYYLVETQPANGYTTAEKVKFKVKDTGEIQKVQMKDKPTVIKIRKVAKHDGRLLLGGAKFNIYDITHSNKGKKVMSFTTKAGEPTVIKAKLVVGKKYRLEEKTAPQGYKTAKDIKFVVKDTPKAQTFTMKDAIDIRFKVPQTGGLSDYINYILIATLLALGLGTVTGVLIRKRRKQ